MKKISLAVLVAVIIVIGMSSCKHKGFTRGISSGDKIQTSFYDLPEQYKEQMMNLLKTRTLVELDKTRCYRLLSFFKQSVLAIKGPERQMISSNYFWEIYNALPEFIDKRERHQGYYRDEKKYNLENQLMAYALYRIDRNPDNISRLFRIIKPALMNHVSVEKYNMMGIRGYVTGLTGCYKYLQQIDGVKGKLAGFYSSVYTSKGAVRKDADKKILKLYNKSAYGFSSYDLSMMLSDAMNIDRYSPYYSSPYLSFWMRRNKEGNMEAVYRILCEINNMYKQQ